MDEIKTLTITDAQTTALESTVQLAMSKAQVKGSTPGFEITLMPPDGTKQNGFRLTLQGSINKQQFNALLPVGTTFSVETIAP